MRIDDCIDNIDIMKTWIYECRMNHIECSKNLENFLPTRLLDSRAFGHVDDIRLVSLDSDTLTDEGYLPEYVTLSHCWGPPERRPVTTTAKKCT